MQQPNREPPEYVSDQARDHYPRCCYPGYENEAYANTGLVYVYNTLDLRDAYCAGYMDALEAMGADEKVGA